MYHFIINPKSRTGNGIKIWTTIKNELDRLTITYTFHYTKYKFHATKLTEEICNEYTGIKNIVVLGGDGTVNEVINGITNFKEVILGYIPSGSSNDLARSLQLPKEPLECLKRILKPKQFRYVDIGVINLNQSELSRKFAVSSGVGFDAAICEETFRSNLKYMLNKLKLGKLTYILIALKQLLFCNFMDGDVKIDGNQIKQFSKILIITSMIHKYEGGGMLIAPGADPSDGKLSICIVHGLSRLQILCLLPTLLIGKHIHFKGVETFTTSDIHIKLQEPAHIHLDGEYPGTYNDIQVSCLANVLRLIV
jgi:YegS/Rv2252/BmrU family lipid kinase